MSFLMRKLLANSGLMDEAGDGTGGTGGSGGAGDTGGAADNAATKAAADTADAAAKAKADDAGKSKTGPTDEEARLLKENMKRKEELKKLAEEKAAMEAKIKEFDGLDIQAIRQMLKDKQESETKHLEAKGDWDRLKTRMAEEHGKEVSTLKSQIAELQAEVNSTKGRINDLSIGSSFSQSKFISDETTLTPNKARVIYGDHFDLENGEIVGYDKPRGAQNRTALVDQYGNPMAFDLALKKIVEADPEKDHLLKSKVKTGAGSNSTKQTGPSGSDKEGPAPTGLARIAKGLSSLNIPKQ